MFEVFWVGPCMELNGGKVEQFRWYLSSPTNVTLTFQHGYTGIWDCFAERAVPPHLALVHNCTYTCAARSMKGYFEGERERERGNAQELPTYGLFSLTGDCICFLSLYYHFCYFSNFLGVCSHLTVVFFARQLPPRLRKAQATIVYVNSPHVYV